MPESHSERDQSDEKWMRRALRLACQGEGSVEPNPMVGCVIVRDGQVIGEGYHQFFGGPHAEVNAIRSAGGDIKGATAYVTLEPCCHHGKTPPCSEALIQSEIGRVVAAMPDPFPAGSDGGDGLRQLAIAGIKTEVGLLREEAESLCAPYLKRLRTGMPWVIAKWAMTIDGRIATSVGESQWITCDASRRQVHQLRSRVDAICVGMGTVEADNPSLTARLADAALPLRTATRVVFCRHRVPDVKSKLVHTAREVPVVIVTGATITREQISALRDCGVSVWEAGTDAAEEMVRVAVANMGKDAMTNVVVEGGGELLASFWAADQLDECHVFMGAKIFGGQNARGPIGGLGVEKIADAPSWKLFSVDRFDSDIRAIYRKPS